MKELFDLQKAGVLSLVVLAAVSAGVVGANACTPEERRVMQPLVAVVGAGACAVYAEGTQDREVCDLSVRLATALIELKEKELARQRQRQRRAGGGGAGGGGAE